jgi:hypothetical protein
MNEDKPYEKRIEPFNFMLIGSGKTGVILCLPYDKDITRFNINHSLITNQAILFDNLPLPSGEYLHTLEEI